MRTAPAVLAAGVVLLGSYAWLDFTTSGLETPLSVVLLVAFAAAYRLPPGERRLRMVAVLGGLAAATRLDLSLLCAPAVLVAARGVAPRAAVRCLALGAMPVLLWSLFALVYCGDVLPIAAHAKVCSHGVPAGDVLAAGAWYLWRNLQVDLCRRSRSRPGSWCRRWHGCTARRRRAAAAHRAARDRRRRLTP